MTPPTVTLPFPDPEVMMTESFRGAPADWWRSAVVYEIYPRSFADSDGDGIGDLLGARSRLRYLADLAVDAIWLTPFYPSPLIDGGYDVADYRDVDPRLGTLADFDSLVSQAHDLGIRVLVDIVPNHTSNQHPWFQEACAAPSGHRARGRYHFHDGAGPDGDAPPSDWRSHFGGSAWERLPDGQWYLHLFSREQPDLNWDNPEVRQYFLDTLRFWADRGVDGFRVDAAHALIKDMSEPLRSQPTLDTALPLDGTDPLYDRDDLHEVYRTWREVFEEYDPPRAGVAETWAPGNERTYLYARPTELGQVFDFCLVKSAWGRDEFLGVIQQSLSDHAMHADVGGGMTWVLSSHDVQRHASRLALPAGLPPEDRPHARGAGRRLDLEVGPRRARAATLMMLALPGSAYLYQGEELGLPEVTDLPADALQDPIVRRGNHGLPGRDGCRVPLPWTRSGPSFGFGGDGAWLPQPPWFADYAVEDQQDDPSSSLTMYRRALALRRALQRPDATVTWLSVDDREVLHFRRTGGWECFINFSTEHKLLPGGEVLISSGLLDCRTAPPESTTWLRGVCDEYRAP